MSMINLGKDDDFDDISPFPDYYIPNHKTKAKLDRYKALICQLEEYFEYMYESRTPEQIKEDMMLRINHFNENMENIYGT